MTEMINICIASKGRAGTSRVLGMAEVQKDRSFYTMNVFVEPQEVAAYRKAYPTLAFNVIPDNDRGLPYVRQFIKVWAEVEDLDYYWMVDDDISAFTRAPHKAVDKGGFELLLEAQKDLVAAGVAIGALEYSQYAWSASREMAMNSYCDVCVFMDVRQMEAFDFRPETTGKCDRDIVIQVLAAGLTSGRTTKYAFNAPKNGSNAGGLKESYYTGSHEERSVEVTAALWPKEWCEKMVKPDGRVDLKIHWKKIGKPLPDGEQSSLFE